jgi:hypothetical protein
VLIVYPVSVYAVSKPSVPQFSVKFIDKSYDVPPTQTKDHYTGKTTTQPGYIVQEGKIEVTINNLPSTSYKTSNGYECKLYYRVQYTGHFEENWIPFSIMYYGTAGDYIAHFVESSSGKHTVVSQSFNDFNTPPSGAQLDFRVQALYAYYDPSTINHMSFVHEALLVEETSGDYSSIQTITMNYGSSSSTKPSQTANSSNTPTTDLNNPPQLNLIIVVVSVCVITVLLAVIVYQYRQSKTAILSTANP